MSDTVYIKLSQSTEVYEPEVRIKDIARVHCQNRSVEARIRSIKVTTFKDRDREGSYVGSVMDLLEELEGTGSSIQVSSVGETDFVVLYKPRIKRRAVFQWLKTAFVSAVSFCGAAFAIMTFNNDANVTDVFGNLYRLIMGTEPQGITLLEISYSAGLSLGILVFFNHFASWKITVDPTPIEVEMRLYEENLDKTLIQNAGRREAQTDVR
ncbi:MAG: stage V sporulation protein AA [Sakamotonia sp.]